MMKIADRSTALVLCILFAGPVLAKLPPPTDEEKAKASEAAAKTAWTEKVGQYKTCLAEDRVAQAFRKGAQGTAQVAGAPVSVKPCADPGPYVETSATAGKPLEASEAHSPPATAVSPPSTPATGAEIAGGVKKPAPQ